MSKKPNILFIMADQLSALALKFINKKAVSITPNLDKLVENSAVFTNAYCPSPLCTPSRYGIMSGQFIKNHHGYDNAAILDSLTPTFAHYLRLNNYETILSGKMHFVGSDQYHGFERRLTTDIYPADFGWVPNWHEPKERIDLWYHNMSSVKQAGVAEITNQLDYDDEVLWSSKREIYRLARREDSRPFCMVSSFIHPHDPYAARQKYWDAYDKIKIPMPNIPRPAKDDNDAHGLRLEKAIDLDKVAISDNDILRARRAYFANITMVDEMIGELIAALKATNQYDNTIIIISSDHGDMLGERGLWYKMTFRDFAAKVPLIIHYPHAISPKIIENSVSLIDLLPTLNDLTEYNGAIAAPIDGVSWASLLNGGNSHPPTICEYTAEGAIEPMLMVREGNYKYIYAPADGDILYNLENDPHESNNISAYKVKITQRLQRIAKEHWDIAQMRQKIIANQDTRRILHQALRQGQYQPWDYQPIRDASTEYSRSHLDLTNFDVATRFPRPNKFP